MQYIAFNLSLECRKQVLAQCKPRYEQVFCEHVTHLYGVDRDVDTQIKMPEKPKLMRAYAYVCDDLGLECLLVQVDGQRLRPDGKPYHLTLSLADGRKQSDSNQVIETFQSTPLLEPIVPRRRALLERLVKENSMFGRRSTTTSGGPISAPRMTPLPAPPPAPPQPEPEPEPEPVEISRMARVTRRQLINAGSSFQAYMYFSVIAPDPDAENSEDARDCIYHSSAMVTITNGFATLEPGDKLSVVLKQDDSGTWELKNFLIVLDSEEEKARLRLPKPEAAGSLPPRHPLRAPR